MKINVIKDIMEYYVQIVKKAIKKLAIFNVENVRVN